MGIKSVQNNCLLRVMSVPPAAPLCNQYLRLAVNLKSYHPVVGWFPAETLQTQISRAQKRLGFLNDCDELFFCRVHIVVTICGEIHSHEIMDYFLWRFLTNRPLESTTVWLSGRFSSWGKQFDNEPAKWMTLWTWPRFQGCVSFRRHNDHFFFFTHCSKLWSWVFTSCMFNMKYMKVHAVPWSVHRLIDTWTKRNVDI